MPQTMAEKSGHDCTGCPRSVAPGAARSEGRGRDSGEPPAAPASPGRLHASRRARRTQAAPVETRCCDSGVLPPGTGEQGPPHTSPSSPE